MVMVFSIVFTDGWSHLLMYTVGAINIKGAHQSFHIFSYKYFVSQMR
jgi:hypothetical protein